MSYTTPSQVLQRLKEGNKRFIEDSKDGMLQDSSRRVELTAGQTPFAVVLSCADSRVVPEFAFDTGLGELFVIRVAGNVANTSTIASIEYAVAHLGTQVIVVLGHENCGAVTAAVQGGDNGANLNHLLAHITPAMVRAQTTEINEVVKMNAEVVAEDLVRHSPIIANAIGANKLKILPAYYHLYSGEISFL